MNERNLVVAKSRMLVDWISCSITHKPSTVIELLRTRLRNPWTISEHGPEKYTRTHKCGDITLYTDAPNDHSIRVHITGKGCRQLEQAGTVTDWPLFLSFLLEAGANFTRLDFAIDDKDGLLDLETIVACCCEGRVVSRYSHHSQTESLDATTGKKDGQMIAFGTRGSTTYIRIYDKALKEKVAGPWIRVELETRDKRAQALAKAVVDGNASPGNASIVPRTLLNYLDFKEQGTSLRRERWPTALWWSAFLQTTSPLRLAIAPCDQTIETSYAWLLRTASRNFARVYDAGQGDELVQEMLKAGRRRLHYTASNSQPSPTANQVQQPTKNSQPRRQIGLEEEISDACYFRILISRLLS